MPWARNYFLGNNCQIQTHNFLSELLASAGIDVLYHTAVGDNPRRLRQAVEIAPGPLRPAGVHRRPGPHLRRSDQKRAGRVLRKKLVFHAPSARRIEATLSGSTPAAP